MSDPLPPDIEVYYNQPGYSAVVTPAIDSVFDEPGFTRDVPVIEGPPESTTTP